MRQGERPTARQPPALSTGERHAAWRHYAALLIAGFALRVGVALATRETNDIETWEGFGAAIAQAGLRGHEGEIRVAHFPINHPPHAADYALGVRTLASGVELPFALLLQAPRDLGGREPRVVAGGEPEIGEFLRLRRWIEAVSSHERAVEFSSKRADLLALVEGLRAQHVDPGLLVGLESIDRGFQ